MSTEKNRLRQKIEINLGSGKKIDLLANDASSGKGKKKITVIAEDAIKDKKFPDKKKK